MSTRSQGFFLTKSGQASDAFTLDSFEIRDPKGTEVLIESEAFGLNYADVMARRGLYREAPALPSILGYEVVGKVIQCGVDANQNLLGKRVVAFCRFGGYAQHVITDDFAVVEVSDEEASELLALCTQAVTAYYMTEYLTHIHAIDTVLVHAAGGGVGTILIQLAKLKGATVIAKIGRDEKRKIVESLNADFIVNYRKTDYAKEIQRYLGTNRLDISFNPVAGATFKKDFSLLGSGGRMVLFGGADLLQGKWGIFSKINFLRKMGLVIPIGLMMRSKNILGVNMLKIAENKPKVLEYCLMNVIRLYQEKKIRPQTGGVYAPSELSEAHEALESGSTTGKLSIHWR